MNNSCTSQSGLLRRIHDSELAIGMRRYTSRLLRYFTGLTLSKELVVFESEVGVKYRNGRFDSRRFGEYVIQEIPFAASNLDFSNLIMPPDLLRNRYTLCGNSVLQSPHYQLIEELAHGNLTLDSEYIARARLGTLDARNPVKPALKYLASKHQLRREELFSDKRIEIFVTEVVIKEKRVYVIADGKHRAALVAYYNRPESLHLRVISNEFSQDPFFRSVYGFTLCKDPQGYSINQEMIKALQNAG